MRKLLVFYLLPYLFLVACGDEGNDDGIPYPRVDAQIVIDGFTRGSQWCSEPKNDECKAVETLDHITKNGISLNLIMGELYSYKVKTKIDIFLRNNMICADLENITEKIFAYNTSDKEGRIGRFDKLVKFEKLQNFRTLVGGALKAEGEKCYAYYSMSEKNGQIEKFFVVEYIDGIRQLTDKKTGTGKFFTRKSLLSLHNEIK